MKKPTMDDFLDALDPSIYRIMQELHDAYERHGLCQICGGGSTAKRMEKNLAQARLEEVEKTCEEKHEPLLKRIKDYQETATNALREARSARAGMEREVKERHEAERRGQLAETRLKQYERALLRIIVTVGKAEGPLKATLAEMVEADKVMKTLSAAEKEPDDE